MFMTTREDVIRRIVERDLKGESLDRTRIQQDDPAIYKSACDKFANWETALKYAGTKRRRPVTRVEWTPEKVVQRMRKLCATGYSLSETRNKSRDRGFYDAANQALRELAKSIGGCWNQSAERQNTRQTTAPT